MTNEKIEPIRIENPETGKSYIVEFDRYHAKMMERETGVNLLNIQNRVKNAPMDTLSNLFYYGLQMHHEGELTQDEADDILFDGMEITSENIGQLIKLYAQAYASMRVDASKNAKWVMR